MRDTHETGNLRVAYDIGGTFTDVITLEPDGRLGARKVLSLIDEVGEMIRRLVDASGHAAADFRHGTTVASNMVIERTTAPTGFITTRGFRDILDMRGHRRPATFDPTWERLPAYVPRFLCREVRGRVLASGTVEEDLDEAEVEAALQSLVDEGVTAVAVSLLNSYVNPEHEVAVARVAASRFPELIVCLSSELDPEINEYQRGSTTAINASLVPGVRGYLDQLDRSIKAVTESILVMRSNGGVMTPAVARDFPVYMIESGPAAGALAAASLAREADLAHAIAFDMGGTTAKACLIDDGEPLERPGGEIGAAVTAATRLYGGGGYAVRTPSLDIVEVGTGGGSIAWLDASGALRVGPRSSGAEPGPACYGRGGTAATVTDANVVLGYINPAQIADATLDLHHDLATRAVQDQIAEPLDISVLEAAYGICEVANASMMRALRAVTTERGRDPREMSLIGFGGAGPMHAARLAEFLGIQELWIPPLPGLFSAVGLLFADLRSDHVRTIARPLSVLNARELGDAMESMRERTRADAVAQGADPSSIVWDWHGDFRYVGQTAEIDVDIPAELAPDALVEALPALVAKAYADLFGYAPEAPAELFNLRVRATVPNAAGTLSSLTSAPTLEHAPEAQRRAYFGRDVGAVDVPVLRRAHLDGNGADGPLIIEDPDTTIVVPPGWRVSRRNEIGALVLRRTA